MTQPSKWDHDSAVVADPILVPVDAENAARLPSSATKQLKFVDFAIEQTSDPPTITKDEAASCSIIKKQSETGKFQTILQKLSRSGGDIPHSRNMKQSLKNGNSMHYQRMKIPLIHL